jgi:hypothetical protein
VEALLLRMDPLLHIFKLGPLIAAIVYIGQVMRIFWHSNCVAELCCS